MNTVDNTPKKKIKRSRLGCHRCKRLKNKCSEEKPSCNACLKAGEKCDYSIKLMWGGRPFKNKGKKQRTHLTSRNFKGDDSYFETVPTNFVTGHYEVQKKFSMKEEKEVPIIQYTPQKIPEQDHEVLRPYNIIVSYMGLAQSSSLETTPCSKSESLTEYTSGSQGTPLEEYSPVKIEDYNCQGSPAGSESRLSDLAEVCTNFADEYERVNGPAPPQAREIMTPEFLNPLEQKKPVVESRLSPDHYKIIEVSGSSEYNRNDAELAFLGSSIGNIIPPLLTLLPELLSQVPYYRQLFRFWVDVASHNLVPAPTLYRDNPFRVLLPQMAMHYSGVLTTILAFAARTLQSLNDTHSNVEVIERLLGRSCNELLRQLEDKSEATSDGTLATILLLSSYEVVHSEDFEKHRTHAYGAGQIIVARKRKKSDNPPASDDSDGSCSSSTANSYEESNIAYFLMRWYTYVDVIGALSATMGREKYLRAYRGSNEYRPLDSVCYFEIDYSTNQNREIDYLLGFDVRMFPHFVNIVLLIDEVDKYISDPMSDQSCLPQSVVAAALELKDKLTQDHETAEQKRQVHFDIILESNFRTGVSSRHKQDLLSKDNILRCTNKLFFYAALLNLYRRVLLLPRGQTLVQSLVVKMVEILKKFIEPGSPAEICTIFCNFSCACEVIDSEMKFFFLERFTKLAQQGIANATKSLAVMGRCWETGEDWLTAAGQLGIDLVLM